MPKQVNVVVTGQMAGRFWSLSPYNPAEGVRGAPKYLVPTYKMSMNDNSPDFEVIRFGLKRTNITPPPKTRICDVGLFKQNIYKPSWLPSYRVHSGPGSLPGAWQLYGSFLIHEGSPSPDDAWGTYGCIEVVGLNEWRRFLESIKRISGASLAEVGHEKLLMVEIKAAAAPTAKLK